ncbi:UNVERIFIED_CONTAM: hypothetical protein FKN15_047795 [Acipenser sinensis]
MHLFQSPLPALSQAAAAALSQAAAVAVALSQAAAAVVLSGSSGALSGGGSSGALSDGGSSSGRPPISHTGDGPESFASLLEWPPLLRFSFRAGSRSPSSWKGQHATSCPISLQARHQPSSSKPPRRSYSPLSHRFRDGSGLYHSHWSISVFYLLLLNTGLLVVLIPLLTPV